VGWNWIATVHVPPPPGTTRPGPQLSAPIAKSVTPATL
jgi:hypothetical protein